MERCLNLGILFLVSLLTTTHCGSTRTRNTTFLVFLLRTTTDCGMRSPWPWRISKSVDDN